MEEKNRKPDQGQDQGQEQEIICVPEVEGDRWWYYYVCSECHGMITWGQKTCKNCNARIDWNG